MSDEVRADGVRVLMRLAGIPRDPYFRLALSLERALWLQSLRGRNVVVEKGWQGEKFAKCVFLARAAAFNIMRHPYPHPHCHQRRPGTLRGQDRTTRAVQSSI